MNFSRGGTIHLAVGLAIVAAGMALAWLLRRKQDPRRLLWAAAIGLAFIEIQWYVYCFKQGWVGGLPDLPLHLCDITLWLTVWVLLRPRPRLFDIVYYWALGGTTMALLMPDVEQTAMSYPIWHFFIAHGWVVAVVLGLAWGKRLRPGPGSWRTAWLALNGYMLGVAGFNVLAQTNYLYLRQKPAQPSILDYMGGWPWYILIADVLALGLFGLLYLPYKNRTHLRKTF